MYFLLLSVLAFAGGVCGLVYEVLWMRMLALVFGSTVYAAGAVLAVFMGGLALGAAWLGRRADRAADPLKFYAFLEAVTGLYALATPWILRSLPPVSLAQAVGLSFLVLLPPTLCMGGTLPALVRALVLRGYPAGVSAARFYFLNTLGAALGAVLGGFVLIAWMGITRSIWLAAAGSMAVAGCAFYLALRWPVSGPSRESPQTPETQNFYAPRRVFQGILFIAALSGAAALTYEILWTRCLVQILGSSIYAYSLILAAFLAGIALGSILIASYCEQKEFLYRRLGWAHLWIAASSLLALALVSAAPHFFVRLAAAAQDSFWLFESFQFGMVFLILLVPAIFMGAALPLAIAALAAPENTGSRVGFVYAVNTLGAAAGALGAAFFLLPGLGLQGAMKTACWASVAAGLIAFGLDWTERGQKPGKGILTAAALAMILIAAAPGLSRHVLGSGVFIYADLFLRENSPLFRPEDRRELLFSKDGLGSTVDVWRYPDGALNLNLNGKIDASTGPDMPAQLLSAHLPALLAWSRSRAPFPEEALIIGLGSGVTLAAAARHPFKRIECVEIEPAVVEASKFFKPVIGEVLSDPRVHLLVRDGRHHLAASPKRFGLIISEPPNPWISGVAALFTQEHYRNVRSRLFPQGLFCQWFQLYRMRPQDLKMQLATFLTVFPHAYLWEIGRDALLIGSMEPLEVDAGRLEIAYLREELKRDMARAGVGTPLSFLARFVMGPSALKEASTGAPLNTDDRPRLELNAPKALYDFQDRWFPQNAELLAKHREYAGSHVKNFKWHGEMMRAYLRQGRWDVAAAAVRDMNLNPADYRSVPDFLYLDARTGDRENAARHLSLLRKFLSGSGRLDAQWGRILAQAEKNYKPDFNSAGIYWVLGQMYNRLEDTDMASRMFEETLREDPEYLSRFSGDSR